MAPAVIAIAALVQGCASDDTETPTADAASEAATDSSMRPEARSDAPMCSDWLADDCPDTCMKWIASPIDTTDCCVREQRALLCEPLDVTTPIITCLVDVSSGELFVFGRSAPRSEKFRACSSAEQDLFRRCSGSLCADGDAAP